MSNDKIPLLQRQQAFQRAAINTEHKLIVVCKDHIKWLKGVPDIASTKTRIDGLYKCVEASRKRIAKLAEMQKFTKGQLQEAYSLEMMFKSSSVGETFLYWPPPLQPIDDHTSYMKPGGERQPRSTEKYQKHPSDFLWNNAPGGLWHDATTWKWETTTAGFTTFVGAGGTGLRHDLPQPSIVEIFKRQQYKHNPNFMGEAPAAEVGSFVGEEL